MRARHAALKTLTIGAALAACACLPPSNVRPLIPGAAAEPYVEEFRRLEKLYRKKALSLRLVSPAGDITVGLEPGAEDACRSVWLERSGAPRELILRVRDSDPGSGTSMGFAWSGDGRAVFMIGSHSGIDCPWKRQHGELRIIYTLGDQVAWEVPPRGP